MGKNRKNRCVRMTDHVWRTAEDMAKEMKMSSAADYIDRAIMYQAIRDNNKKIKALREMVGDIEKATNPQEPVHVQG